MFRSLIRFFFFLIMARTFYHFIHKVLLSSEFNQNLIRVSYLFKANLEALSHTNFVITACNIALLLYFPLFYPQILTIKNNIWINGQFICWNALLFFYLRHSLLWNNPPSSMTLPLSLSFDMVARSMKWVPITVSPTLKNTI